MFSALHDSPERETLPGALPCLFLDLFPIIPARQFSALFLLAALGLELWVMDKAWADSSVGQWHCDNSRHDSGFYTRSKFQDFWSTTASIMLRTLSPETPHYILREFSRQKKIARLVRNQCRNRLRP